MKIEELLGLSEENIKSRVDELEKRIPTYPGIEYLKIRNKLYDVQPWLFIEYLAYNAPLELRDLLQCYKDYDGAENYQAILAGLRESYINNRLRERLEEKYEKEKAAQIS